jgi:CRISPR-associated endonuclease/helicase Cas3
MVVLNTIRSAQDVYRSLKDTLDNFDLYFLSASLIPVHREKRLKEVRVALESQRKVGLVATQVVEAGVDLDFDVVVRDFAPLDSVVQAAGRCNRNAMEQYAGRVFVVKLSDPSANGRYLAGYVYDGVLLEIGRDVLGNCETLPEDKYLRMVEAYFEKLKERKAQEKQLLDDLLALNYGNVGMFTLVETRFYQVPVFVEFDRDAKKLIEKLEQLYKMEPKTYEERMQRRNLFKALKPKLWGYVVNVPANVVVKAGLSQLPYASGFLYLPRDHLDFTDIYREDTGFVRKIEHKALFL